MRLPTRMYCIKPSRIKTKEQKRPAIAKASFTPVGYLRTKLSDPPPVVIPAKTR